MAARPNGSYIEFGYCEATLAHVVNDTAKYGSVGGRHGMQQIDGAAVLGSRNAVKGLLLIGLVGCVVVEVGKAPQHRLIPE